MNDLKSLYKQKSYQINPLVIKNLKNLNLSLNEFLLILFFMNESDFLDLERIKSSLDFTEEEILNVYSELLNKGIIEVIMEKQNGKVSEIVS